MAIGRSWDVNHGVSEDNVKVGLLGRLSLDHSGILMTSEGEIDHKLVSDRRKSFSFQNLLSTRMKNPGMNSS